MESETGLALFVIGLIRSSDCSAAGSYLIPFFEGD
jgi:hypothetical protein